MLCVLFVIAAIAMPFSAAAQDPAKTDADKYSVVLENERVWVLRYRDRPGEKTSQHARPDFVLHALSSFTRRLTFPDGLNKSASPGRER